MSYNIIFIEIVLKNYFNYPTMMAFIVCSPVKDAQFWGLWHGNDGMSDLVNTWFEISHCNTFGSLNFFN